MYDERKPEPSIDLFVNLLGIRLAMKISLTWPCVRRMVRVWLRLRAPWAPRPDAQAAPPKHETKEGAPAGAPSDSHLDLPS